jgi:hypothetical protein
MRVRLAILIALAVLFCAAALLCVWHASVLGGESQLLYGDGSNSTTPTPVQQARASELWAQAGAFQQVVTPFATAAMLCVTAVLAILGWRWELRARPRAR